MKPDIPSVVQEYLIEYTWLRTRNPKPKIMVYYDDCDQYEGPIILTGKTLEEIWEKLKIFLFKEEEVSFTSQDFNNLTIEGDIVVTGSEYEVKYRLIPRNSNET